MNIFELDHCDLSINAKFKDTLNPIIWDRHEHLKNAVKDQILVGVDEYCQYLGLSESQIKDIIIAGPSAGYNYKNNSKIDVVVIAELNPDPVFRELFNENKYKYNGQQQVKIHDQYVQFYVQPEEEPVVSRGSYSVLTESWIQVPVRRLREANDTVAHLTQLDLAARPKPVDRPRKTVIKEAVKITYGYGPDYLDEVGLTPDGTNSTTDQVCEVQLDEVGLTPDGTNPTTRQVTNERGIKKTKEEEIIQDFVDFCSDRLQLENPVKLKLKRDPEWSKRNLTFGRYNSMTDNLEIAVGQRHIMDVLRTIAHELTHKRQHETTEVPDDAGETGSPFENEANARAGVLMREYGEHHPEFFLPSGEELDEGAAKKVAMAAAVVAALSGDPAAAQSVQSILGNIQNIGTMARTAQRLTRAGINQEVQQEVVNYIQANGGQANSQNLSQLYQLQRQLQQQEPAQNEPLSGYTQQPDPVKESASGYIPTKRQARDPRFSMALTKDIRPGALGLNANKLRLNTNKQGEPQLARADGIVQRMKEQLERFKKNGVLAEAEELDEVKMSPTALKKFAASPAAKGILVGFEAELIFPDVRTEDEDPEYEPDYDMDTRPSSIQEVIEFFSNDEWGYGLSERQQERLQENLDEAYMEWYDEQMLRDFGEEAEDYIRKIMVDDGDWDEDNEIQKQLYLLDLPDDEINKIINAGERAPKFTSSKEQQEYSEANPDYKKYLDAQEEAQDLLDTLIQDEMGKQGANWDAALDDFRDHYQLDDDSGFFSDVGLSYMSDIANRFDLGWPYMTSSNDGEGNLDIEDVALSLKDVVQMPVTASGGYHQATRKPGVWIVEPDGSLSPDSSEDGGLEIISPPMPIEQAMEKLNQVIEWAQARGCYTNSSTGLHMGVSLPGQKSFAEAEGDVESAPATEKPIDFMKLALFLGDQHVLKQFEREANSYCRSSLEKLKAKNWSPQQIATAMEKMRGNLINLAYKDLADRSPGRDSINMKDNYVEFRSAGGDYLSKESDQGIDFLFNTMLRYVRALDIAGDPAAERQEYAKKLYKLISPEGDNTLDLFSKFATGEITSEQLKKDWAKKTLEKDKPKQGEERDWEAYNPDTGEILGTVKDFSITNATNYFRDEMKLDRFQVREKDPELTTSRAKFAKNIIQKPEEQPQQWIVYDTKTGEVHYDQLGRKSNLEQAMRKMEIDMKLPKGQLAIKLSDNQPDPAQAKDYYYEIVNLGDVNLGVVDKFYAADKQDADATFDKWLEMKGLPNDTSNYGYRPRKQEPTLSAQDAADLQRNTERGEWEFYRTETGNVIDRVNDVDRMQANAVRDRKSTRLNSSH